MNSKPDYVVKTEDGWRTVKITEDTPTKTVTVNRYFMDKTIPTGPVCVVAKGSKAEKRWLKFIALLRRNRIRVNKILKHNSK